MRVVMLIQHFHPLIGGAERQLLQVAPLLQRLGVDVHVVTRRLEGLSAFETVNGVPVHRLPIPGNRVTASLSYTLAAQPLLRRLKPDVLHAYEMLSPTTTAVLAKRWSGTPLVVKVLSGNEFDVVRGRPGGPRRLSMFLDKTDRFHVVSSEIDAALGELGVPESRRVEVPNGVDVEHYAPPTPDQRHRQRDALGIDRQAPVVIYTGRLVTYKGILTLLEAWTELRRQRPDAELLVLGTGENEAAVRAAESQGVRYVGPVVDVQPYLHAADVFTLPSEAEGMSNSLLEAMASGLVPVVSAVGGSAELLGGRDIGRLVPPRDPPAVTSALLSAIDEVDAARGPDGISTAGLPARELVAREFSLATTARRLHDLYVDLADGGASRAIRRAS